MQVATKSNERHDNDNTAPELDHPKMDLSRPYLRDMIAYWCERHAGVTVFTEIHWYEDGAPEERRRNSFLMNWNTYQCCHRFEATSQTQL